MHTIFAGFMGVLTGISTFFHGGTMPHQPIAMTSTHQVSNSASTASSSGAMKHGRMQMNLPQGEVAVFGTVSAENGTTLTLQMPEGRMGMMMINHNPDVTITPMPSMSPTMKTLIVDLATTTTYTGGSQSDIKVNTKIAGVGKTNTDGSITAVSIQINPTRPSGMPQGGPHYPRSNQ